VSLLYCHASHHNPFQTRERVSVYDFVEYLEQAGTEKLDVYDYTIDDPNQRTKAMAIHDVIAYFKKPADQRTALNFLDIENRRGDYCPTPIILHSLLSSLSQLSSATHNDRGMAKTNSTWTKQLREFFLLSSKNAISQIHADTAG
ncbi:hypothetical protein BO94DRAFT_605660, partial [Aspergillus sclerotioniger CBS 115572]